MKQNRPPTLLTLIALTLAVSPVSAQDDGGTVSDALLRERGEPFVLGEAIAKLKPGAEVRSQMDAAADAGTGVDPEVRVTSGGELIFRLDSGTAGALAAGDLREQTLALVESLRQSPDVEYAEPNYIQYPVATTPDDTRYDQQWHYLDQGSGAGQSPGGIGLPQAWDVTTGDRSVVAAVIDTGILPGHPDITGSANVLPGFDMISDPFFANDGDGRDPDPTDPGDAVAAGECPVFPPNEAEDDSWHGTHVAGTIGVGNTDNGAGVAGINWQVGLVSVRVLGKCGGTVSDITDGMRWAAGMDVPGVPPNANPARIINLSLGGRGACTTTYQNAIDDVVARGVTVVVAAGNRAQDASGFRPASCDDVITVAASEARGRLATRYSNFGDTVEILAPGGETRTSFSGNPDDGVLSMVNPSSGTFDRYNGTSMAAPHVAGVAALMLACDPALTRTRIFDVLQSTARPRNNTQCPQPCGIGLLDAAAALAAVAPCGPGGGSPTLTLAPSRADLDIGDTAVLTATTLPGATVSFSSSDESVATVAPANAVADTTGLARTTVTGAGAGPATVTATSGTLSATSTVRVSGNPGLSLWSVLALALGAARLVSRRRQEGAP